MELNTKIQRITMMYRLAVGGAMLAVVALSPSSQAPKEEAFTFTSPEFKDGGKYPQVYTCDGESASPPVAWANPPKGTKAFALSMHHIARDNERHVYWLIGNIPASTTSIPKNAKKVGVMGVNTVNGLGRYAPPCSKGPGPKQYILTLYALSSEAKFPDERMNMDQFLAAIKDKTLSSKTMKVTYSRPDRGF